MTARSPNEIRAELALLLAEHADDASLPSGTTRPKFRATGAEWQAAKTREMTIALTAAEAAGWRFVKGDAR